MTDITLRHVPVNGARLFGYVLGIILASVGAAILWGAGAFFFVLGMLLFLDALIDDAMERATMTRHKTGR